MPQEDKLLDISGVSGLNGALIILRIKKALAEIDSGQILKVVATDPVSLKWNWRRLPARLRTFCWSRCKPALHFFSSTKGLIPVVAALDGGLND